MKIPKVLSVTHLQFRGTKPLEEGGADEIYTSSPVIFSSTHFINIVL